MRPFRPRTRVPALALGLAAIFLTSGCFPPGQAAPGGPALRMEGRQLSGPTSQGDAGTEGPADETPSAPVLAEDARGEAIPGLPPPPGSVRADYSEGERGGLALVRAAYVVGESPDRVRGFYRGALREEDWQVANVEYTGDVWHFLVLRGDLEAQIEVLPREGGSGVEIELSGPAGDVQESSAASAAGGSKR